jgi:hypothetical protein
MRPLGDGVGVAGDTERALLPGLWISRGGFMATRLITADRVLAREIKPYRCGSGPAETRRHA